MNFHKKFMVILYGPTGVGKSDVAERIAANMPAVIINLDMGQCYEPLSIGTAKPDWKNSTIPHYLFDCVQEPINFSAHAYREMVRDVLESVWKQGKVPLVVGGSGFYLKSLLYPPSENLDNADQHVQDNEIIDNEHESLWDRIHRIDPDRAAQIHPHDTYRLQRAYILWKKTGRKPSLLKPVYSPLAPYSLICITRDRDELYNRINDRVVQMINQGWVNEVEKLRGTAWENFLKEKKIIGYDDLLKYLEHGGEMEDVIQAIQQKTRNYAKRQLTFWRMLERQLSQESAHAFGKELCVVNLTLSRLDLYISQLSDMVLKHYYDEK